MVGVDKALADLDVSLVDQHTGLMDALGLEPFLVDTGLQSLIQELIQGKTQHVIELEFLIAEETVAVHSVEEGSAFEESTGVFLFKGEEFSGCFSELGEEEVNSPDLTLVLEAVLADQLQFVIDSFLLEGSSGGFECRGVWIKV